jgi:DMSO reductase family type II enzyme chaperone
MAQTTNAAPTQEQEMAIALARSEVYRWLSLGVRYPDEAVKRQLQLPERRQRLLEACRVLEDSKGHHLTDLAEGLVRHLWQHAIQEIETSYIRAFGHIARGRLSLYETEYGDGQALRAVHELGDIAGFYRAFGLEIGRAVGERVDHAGVECAFLHVLCYKEAYAIAHHGPQQHEMCREAQARFLREHLGWWMPSMARRVLDLYAGTFYAAWAELTLAFLAQERQRFGLPHVSEHLGLRTPEPSLEAGCMSCSIETACPGGRDALGV